MTPQQFLREVIIPLAQTCKDARLGPVELAHITRPEPEIHDLHNRAQTGDTDAQAALCVWGYAYARVYSCCYRAKRETLLTLEEAEEVAGEFYSVIQKYLREQKINNVIAFSFRVTRTMTNRLLHQKRRLHLEDLSDDMPGPTGPFIRQEINLQKPDERQMLLENPDHLFFSDEERKKLHCLRTALETSNDITTKIALSRFFQEPPVPFNILATDMNITAEAARNRAKRFRNKVISLFKSL